MATTAKIAKDIKLEKHRIAKTPKLQCRHRNRCWRCGRPRAFLRKFGVCRLCFRQFPEALLQYRRVGRNRRVVRAGLRSGEALFGAEEGLFHGVPLALFEVGEALRPGL